MLPVGLGTNNVSAVGITVAITVGAAVPVGDCVIVGGGGSAANGVIASIADSRGNTYAVDKSTATAKPAGIGHSILTTALQASDTITITFTTSASGVRGGWAADIGPIASSPAPDKTNANSNATSVGWDGGASGVLTYAGEVVFGAVCGTTAKTSTPNNPFTELYDFNGNSTTWGGVYVVTTVTGSVTPGGTWSGSGSPWDCDSASYVLLPTLPLRPAALPVVYLRRNR